VTLRSSKPKPGTSINSVIGVVSKKQEIEIIYQELTIYENIGEGGENFSDIVGN
jgi:hypothetical protein